LILRIKDKLDEDLQIKEIAEYLQETHNFSINLVIYTNSNPNVTYQFLKLIRVLTHPMLDMILCTVQKKHFG
jgi:hypothetical protein